MDSTIYILDGYGLIYRSYFAFIRNPMFNSRGENTSAIFGFFRTLLSFFDQYKPEYFAVALDSLTPTFRHEMYREYKANRDKTPEDLHPQIPLIEEVLKALGIQSVRVNGVEADDIMGTVAVLCAKEGRDCRLITSDKDMMQLVNNNVAVLRPEKGNLKFIDAEGVFENWNVRPQQIIDYLAMVGDSADNIPGVAGIGPKTAAALLGAYDNLDSVYENVESIKSKSQQKKLLENKENAYLSKKLAIIKTDIDLPVALEEMKIKKLNRHDGAFLLLKQGIQSLAKELAGDSFKAVQAAVASDNAYEAKQFGFDGFSPSGKGTPDLFDGISDFDPGGGFNKEKKAEDSGTPGNGDKNEEQSPENLPFFMDLPSPDMAEKGGYDTVTSLEGLDEWISKIRKAGIYAFDSETDNLSEMLANPVGFSFSVGENGGCYIPLVAGGREMLPKDEVRKRIKSVLEDPKLKLIGQNIKYDYKVLKRWGIEMRNLYFDTMIAGWLLDTEGGNVSMDRLAEQYLGYTTIHFADIVEKGQLFSDVELSKAVDYAAEDADVTFRLYERFLPLLEKNELAELFFDLEMPLVKILGDMELLGISLKDGYLEEYSKELGSKISFLEKKIYDLCGKEFNINSTKQLQTVLFEERQLTPIKKTKTGYSTDTGVLEQLAKEDVVPQRILEYRGLTKLKSTYVDTLPQQVLAETGRIHTTFHINGTATGRIASKDPNLQNIPIKDEEGRKIRRAFVPSEGYVFLSADYSQIELVILAHLSGDPALTETFRRGEDVHRLTGSLLFGVKPEDVSDNQRRIAKTINFGVMYGMSGFRLSNELDIPRKDANAFIETYFAKYAKIKEFIDRTVKSAEQCEYVSTILGRKRRLRNINSRNKTQKMATERVAVNTPIQGTGADIVKKAMLDISRAMKNRAFQSRMLLQVHDELIFEVPESEIDEMKTLVREKMESAIPLRVPVRVNIEIGKSWGELH